MRWVKWTNAADKAFAELREEQKIDVRRMLAYLRGVSHYPVEARPIGDGFYKIPTLQSRIWITFKLTDERVLVSTIFLWF